MVKLTVQEYANKYNTNVQKVYRQIKKGVLKSVKENNKTYIIIDSLEELKEENTFKQNDKQNENNEFIKYLLKENKKLKKLLNKKDKEIKALTKKILEINETKEKLYEKVIGYTLEYKPSVKTNNDEIEINDVEVKKKKNKKMKKDKKWFNNIFCLVYLN